MDFKNSKAFYEEEAKIYDNRRWHTPAGKFNDSVQREILDEFTMEFKDLDILEIGAGTGRFTGMLLDKSESVTVIDISISMLERLRNRLKDHSNKDNLKILQGDARDMDIASSSIDAVVMINALSHIPNHEKVLTEVSHILKPGGLFIFNIPNYEGLYLPFGLYVNLRKKSVTRNVYTRWYSLSQISEELSSLGMEIDDVRGQLHIPSFGPRFILPAIRRIDSHFRNGWSVKFAPILFFKAKKVI